MLELAGADSPPGLDPAMQTGAHLDKHHIRWLASVPKLELLYLDGSFGYF